MPQPVCSCHQHNQLALGNRANQEHHGDVSLANNNQLLPQLLLLLLQLERPSNTRCDTQLTRLTA